MEIQAKWIITCLTWIVDTDLTVGERYIFKSLKVLGLLLLLLLCYFYQTCRIDNLSPAIKVN